MDSLIILILIGFVVGTVGTLIGAGGGFLLVPVLLQMHPEIRPEVVTGISIAIVAVNAVTGALAYARSRRIDYRMGLVFAAYTIPGSIIGVYLTEYIPTTVFSIIFGSMLVLLAGYLLLKGRDDQAEQGVSAVSPTMSGKRRHTLTDAAGRTFTYTYNQNYGILVSIFIGFISPILGIGGGIIHVPAMTGWLQVPVYVATATSQFILAIMSTISVTVHAINGTYNDEQILRLIGALGAGVVPGAVFGAFMSKKLPTVIIVRILAGCLALVGLRILLKSF